MLHDSVYICDIVTYNKKYTFGLPPHFCHRAPKTLGISCEERDKGVFRYVIEVTFEKQLKDGGWLLGAQTMQLEGWNIQPQPPHTPQFRGWKRGWS